MNVIQKKMKEKINDNYQQVKNLVKSNKAVKSVVYFGIGVLSLYILGKTFKGLAETVRGFNELKSAINGR